MSSFKSKCYGLTCFFENGMSVNFDGSSISWEQILLFWGASSRMGWGFNFRLKWHHLGANDIFGGASSKMGWLFNFACKWHHSRANDIFWPKWEPQSQLPKPFYPTNNSLSIKTMDTSAAEGRELWRYLTNMKNRQIREPIKQWLWEKKSIWV